MDRIADLMKTVLPVDWVGSLLPVAASEQARPVDNMFYFILWSCVVLFILVIGPMCFFLYKYRRKTHDQKAVSQTDHNSVLEILWTGLPLIYLAVLFCFGFYGFLDLYTPPLESKELRVIGQKWQWTVQYPDEEISVSGQGGVIGVRLGEPVKLVMASQDVIHSFFIPNFRVKQDVVPGRYSTLWFTPSMLGEFPVFCAEFCGDEHSNMMSVIKVMNNEEYASWLEGVKNEDKGIPPKELGAKLYVKKGCNACHTLDGTTKIGPTLKGVYGKKEELTTGEMIVVDDDYIRESLLEPQAKIPKGFPPVMPTFKGQLSEVEINGLIAYIKSLK